ncbi:MAG: ATPase, partial [Haloarculaceae archaeon]
GISQRPADVKKDFITQCDWLVWHRLTWQNDTKVVRRVLDGSYAEAVEDLDDGEGFLATDWTETVERVQFDRKETFDAGATPGLDDFERPELKSVSDDLVSELQQISEAEARREDEVERLREQLAAREERIRELEEELAEARDLSRMADKFAEAMMEHADATDFEQTTLAEAAAVAEGTPAGDGEAGGDATDDRGDAPADEGDPDAWPEAMEAPEPAGEPPAGWPDDDPDRPIVTELRRELAAMDEITREMLAYYRDHGPAAPVDAHVACGGSGDRQQAYARNRRLRQVGLVRHTGRGQYDYTLHELVATEHGDRLDEATVEAVVGAVEDDYLPASGTAWPEA